MPVAESVPFDAIIHDPGCFLDGLDIEAGRLRYLRCDRERMAVPAFLDGRTSFALDEAGCFLPVQEVFDRAPASSHATSAPRFLFHTGFCGSTLLARSLDLPGRVFSYREPQVLVQLADLKRTGHPWSTDPARWHVLLDFVLGQLSKTWSPGERAIIKPSNWANNLLEDMLGARPASPALFLSIDLRAWLVAVIRGGADRIRFTCKLFEHLQSAAPMYMPLGASTAIGAADGMVPVVRLCALSWYLQRHLLRRAQERCKQSAALDYATLIASPGPSLRSVARLVGIEVDNAGLERIIGEIWPAHAKNAGERFDAPGFEAITARVEQEYGRYLDEAIAWCRDRIPDE